MDSVVKTYVGGESPLTVADWKLAQTNDFQLLRILEHVKSFNPKDPAWITLIPEDHIKQQWKEIELLKQSGQTLPLYGVPYAVKDNIDIAGLKTTAACPDFLYVAKESAAIIKILQSAGAVVVGKCNLDAFATGLVGTRSPYGVVPNTFNKDYISGGSSSGSASIVARGLVPFSLGTDTAGSGRVPAGLNNIIGLKATRGALSARGVVPACRTLDCVSIFTLTLEDARTVFDAAGIYDQDDSYSRHRISNPSLTLSIPRVAICDNPSWFEKQLQMDAYLNSLDATRSLGWRLQSDDFSLLFQLAGLLYEGPWVAERYAAIKETIENPGINIDPVVRSIIEKAKKFSAADFMTFEYLKQDLIRAIEIQFQDYDVILVPTTPTFPTIKEVENEPVLENSRLGTYTNFVNFLDWCAISFPAGFRADGLPFSLTLISTRWQEEKLFQLASQFLSQLPRRLGSTEYIFLDKLIPIQIQQHDHELVVVGAHLSGFPLNHQLTDLGASLNRATSTSASYRLYEIPSITNIRKPGLQRVSEQGSKIDIEIWNISSESMGKLMKTVPHPLAIGSVEISDGSYLKGFLCEPCGLENALDITEFGGWRAYINSLKTARDIDPVLKTNVKANLLPKGVLVANRGEIAVRIISTLKGLGIRSVAVYSSEDSKAQHVSNADEAYLLEGGRLEETYLSKENILKVAKSAEVEAVIPGYGFLSESADFAESCEEAGLIWIGPTPHQMRQLGLKHLARELAEITGVPLLPGTGVVENLSSALDEAEIIGYPIIVKSSAGGGGIGIQQCGNPEELKRAFTSMQHLGKSYFKDDRVFLERFVPNARHIEVQIIGDGNGLVNHIGERDCSLQRRKQKVVEEGPAVFVPEKTRKRMRDAAIALAKNVRYRGVGTVEFIYDLSQKSFYFLEVNTRLQVEHTVTEEVSGLDLVGSMIRVAVGDTIGLFNDLSAGLLPRRVAIEARIYGESPLQNFRPSPGQILNISFPNGARVDTWIKPGTTVSPSFDPLLAKLIVSGYDRPDAIRKLVAALNETKITGIETNINYLLKIIESEIFQKGEYTTTTLDTFSFELPAFEVLDPGPSTTVQDYPGRTGYWNIGIPPSGPMDDYAFRIANRVVGNDVGIAGLECTTYGPTLLFHHDALIAVAGGEATLSIDEKEVSYGAPVKVSKGQTLRLGVLRTGCRAYIAIKGGLNVPKIFGSSSTFALGKTGGHCGRELRTGDIVHFHEISIAESPEQSTSTSALPPYSSSWTVKIMPGPHGFPDFISRESYEQFFSSPWKVHYNSNRVGVRLDGPKPVWARDHGGEAGLHPSNIHDSPYSIGSISFTGDQAVILTCDGPSLGGFVIFATVISAEMWKIGQMKPGDEMRLFPVTPNDALEIDMEIQKSIQDLVPFVDPVLKSSIYDPVLGDIGTPQQVILCRQAGDCALLLEFGDNSFNIRTSFLIHALLETHTKTPITNVVELTPGVRSLHVFYVSGKPQSVIFAALKLAVATLLRTTNKIPRSIPSRTFHLPLAFEHSSMVAAVSRYAQTIRSTAPWLPSNTEFLRRINGLSFLSDVNTTLLASTFLILGLGDVFFGSPCAIPLDPRQRLFGMKYNPSRSFTPEGTVGVGGQYLCIYAVDSPGGYQLVGRTVPIWQRFLDGAHKEEANDRRWLFNTFDQIRFYPISEQELDEARDKDGGKSLIHIEDGTFDSKTYENWLDENKDDIQRVRKERVKCLVECDAVAEALKPPPTQTLLGRQGKGERTIIEGGIIVSSGVAGKCYKVLVEVGQEVEAGNTMFLVEAMKMEIKINATCKGICVAVSVQEGDILGADSRMAVVSPL